MTAGVDLERRLAAWFDEEAPTHAPDRVLAVSLEQVAVVDQRRPIGRRADWAWGGLTRRQRLVVVLAASIALLVAGVVVGAWLVQQVPRPPALVVARADGTFPEPVGLTVLAQRPDGTTDILASWTAEDLGASYSDGAGVAMSPDGHLAVPVSTSSGASEYRILDLRDPTAPPRTPDAESMFGAWGPGERFAMVVNAGGYVAYDAHTGTSIAATARDVGPREISFRPVWAGDGAGIHANGVAGATHGFGALDLDGTVRAGIIPEFPTGIGPRRTAPDGARIQCLVGEDFGCEDGATISRFHDRGFDTLYVDDHPDVRIADFAISADGVGLWLLLETSAPGPRTITLVQHGGDATEREIATFQGEADDPDEGSYFTAASIAAIAPDDSRLVLAAAGPAGSKGALMAVALDTGTTTPLEGQPAGWLVPDTLSSSRPTVEPIAETDPAIRGDWVTSLPRRAGGIPEGFHGLTIHRSSGMVDAGFGELIALTFASEGADTILVRQGSAAIDCAAGSSGRYRWAVEAGLLRLEPTEDDCASRRLLLGRTFEPVLPSGDTAPRPVPGGTSLIASRFSVPFRLVAPPAGLLAMGHGEENVSVSERADGGSVMVVPATAGAAEPCDRFNAGAPLPSGLDAVVTYVEDQAAKGVMVERLADVTIDGRASPTFRLTAPSPCERGLALFAGSGRATTVPDGATVTLVETRSDAIVAIVVSPDVTDPTWTADLLGSIDFLD